MHIKCHFFSTIPVFTSQAAEFARSSDHVILQIFFVRLQAVHFMAEQKLAEAISYKPTARTYWHGVGVVTMGDAPIYLKTTTLAA